MLMHLHKQCIGSGRQHVLQKNVLFHTDNLVMLILPDDVDNLTLQIMPKFFSKKLHTFAGLDSTSRRGGGGRVESGQSAV